MRISSTQILFLRLGAVACLLGAVVLAVAAVTIDSGPPGPDEVTVVDDPTEIALPDPGLFGSRLVVYGASGDSGVAPSDLGCRLLDRTGREQSTAKMSELRAISTPSVTVQDQRLDALFTVGPHPRGSVLACANAESAAPLALSEPSTFGGAGLLVRAVAAAGTITFLVVGLGGLLLTRSGSARGRPGRSPRG